jgi:hypothetical protein
LGPTDEVVTASTITAGIASDARGVEEHERMTYQEGKEWMRPNVITEKTKQPDTSDERLPPRMLAADI